MRYDIVSERIKKECESITITLYEVRNEYESQGTIGIYFLIFLIYFYHRQHIYSRSRTCTCSLLAPKSRLSSLSESSVCHLRGSLTISLTCMH